MKRALGFALLALLCACAPTDTGNPPLTWDASGVVLVRSGDDMMLTALPYAYAPPGTVPATARVVRLLEIDTHAPVDTCPVRSDGSFFCPFGDEARWLRIWIEDADARSSPVDFDVQPFGLVPRGRSLDACVGISPSDALDFGALEQGASASLPLRVDNRCAAPLELGAVMRDGDAGFVIASGAPSSLAAGASATLTIGFEPVHAGETVDALLLTSGQTSVAVTLVAFCAP